MVTKENTLFLHVSEYAQTFPAIPPNVQEVCPSLYSEEKEADNSFSSNIKHKKIYLAGGWWMFITHSRRNEFR